MASRFKGRMLVSQWIEHAQAVVSAILVCRNHAVASEVASQVVVWHMEVAGNKAIAVEI
jgi:hypothetical protein